MLEQPFEEDGSLINREKPKNMQHEDELKNCKIIILRVVTKEAYPSQLRGFCEFSFSPQDHETCFFQTPKIPTLFLAPKSK